MKKKHVIMLIVILLFTITLFLWLRPKIYVDTIDYSVSLDTLIYRGNYKIKGSEYWWFVRKIEKPSLQKREIKFRVFNTLSTKHWEIIKRMQVAGYRPASDLELIHFGILHPNKRAFAIISPKNKDGSWALSYDKYDGYIIESIDTEREKAPYYKDYYYYYNWPSSARFLGVKVLKDYNLIDNEFTTAVSSLDGKRTLSDFGRDVYSDVRFRHLKFNKLTEPTPKTGIRVCEITNNEGTVTSLSIILNTLDKGYKDVCLTQHQIIELLETSLREYIGQKVLIFLVKNRDYFMIELNKQGELKIFSPKEYKEKALRGSLLVISE